MSTTYASAYRSSQAVAAVVCALLFASATSFAQGQIRPQFESTVDLVQFQVEVATGDGDFVTGLAADDFRLAVGGEARDVALVY